jgi:hypothetical protein
VISLIRKGGLEIWRGTRRAGLGRMSSLGALAWSRCCGEAARERDEGQVPSERRGHPLSSTNDCAVTPSPPLTASTSVHRYVRCSLPRSQSRADPNPSTAARVGRDPSPSSDETPCAGHLPLNTRVDRRPTLHLHPTTLTHEPFSIVNRRRPPTPRRMISSGLASAEELLLAARDHLVGFSHVVSVRPPSAAVSRTRAMLTSLFSCAGRFPDVEDRRTGRPRQRDRRRAERCAAAVGRHAQGSKGVHRRRR